MSQTPQPVKISAYLFFGICLLCLCIACPVGFVWVGILQGMGQNMDPNAGLSLGIITLLYGGFMLAYGVVGYFLLRMASWAPMAAIVLAILALFIFPPFSTIMGVVVLVLLLRQGDK
jgi:hypothetical protein